MQKGDRVGKLENADAESKGLDEVPEGATSSEEISTDVRVKKANTGRE